MKQIRLRHTNNVNLSRTFSAHLCGGGRGYKDAMALESYSNDLTPTIKCLYGFILIVEINDEHTGSRT